MTTSSSPRRSVWGETGRLAAVTAAGVLFLVINVGFSIDLGADADSLRFGGLVALDLAMGVAALVVVLFRRRAPLVVAVALALCGAVSSLAAPAALLALASLATRRRPGEIALAVSVWIAGVAAVGLSGFDLLGRPAPLGEVALLLAILVVVLAAVGGRKKSAKPQAATATQTPVTKTTPPPPPPADPLKAGDSYAASLDMDKALASWEQAMEKTPNPELQKKYARAALDMALVYAAANDTARSREHLEKVAKFGPADSEEVRVAKAKLGK